MSAKGKRITNSYEEAKEIAKQDTSDPVATNPSPQDQTVQSSTPQIVILGESSTLGFLDGDSKLINLIRLIKGQGVISDIIDLLGEFDVTALPELIDLITGIIGSGKPTSRTEIIAQLNSLLKLIVVFTRATTTPIDNQLAAIAEQVLTEGAIRDILIRILSSWYGVPAYKPDTLSTKAILTDIQSLGISWVAVFQLAMLIYKIISEMFSQD